MCVTSLSRLLFVEGTPEQLQAYCRERLELEISYEHAVKMLAIAADRVGSGRYTFDDGSLMVLKNELQRLGYFKFTPNYDQHFNFSDYDQHFFFIHIEETKEMLDRLRRRDRTRPRIVEPRSKLCTTAQIIRPIDTVAYRVTRGT